jgi:pimeloyl-ACP methyl ester carboxylesterase
LREALVGFGSLADPATRDAFVHTARSVIDIRGQRVDARDRLYLAADLPLLVVWGEKDAIIPVEHGRSVAAAVPGARLELFAQSGHFPHLTEPRRLAALLRDWLESTEPARLDAHSLTERLRQPV